MLAKQKTTMYRLKIAIKNRKITKKIVNYFMIYKSFLELRKIIFVRYAMDRLFCELPGFIIKNYKLIKEIKTVFEAVFGPINPRIKRWILNQIRKFLIFSAKHYGKRLFVQLLVYVAETRNGKTMYILYEFLP